MIQFFGRCGEDEYEMDVFNGEKRNLKIVYWENVIEDESQLLHKGDPSIPKVNSHLINSDDGFNVNIATKDEQVLIDEAINRAVDALKECIRSNFRKAMSLFN